MAHINQEKTFDALEIRDTDTHEGATINNYDFQLKTIIIHNHLNQAVTLQCRASVDGVNNWFDVGSSFDVTASTDTYQTCSSYFPFMRLLATCSSSPSSGDLTVYFIQYGV